MLFNSHANHRRPGQRGGRGGDAGHQCQSSPTLMAPIPAAGRLNLHAQHGRPHRGLLRRIAGSLPRQARQAHRRSPPTSPATRSARLYLPNYLGMVGVPIDLVPDFPTNATTIFLTAASATTRTWSPRPREFVQKRRPGHRHERPHRGPWRQRFSGHRRDSSRSATACSPRASAAAAGGGTAAEAAPQSRPEHAPASNAPL